jgi:lysylphosphatidylglycerol synthetase-like protein (DUF2156 family)
MDEGVLTLEQAPAHPVRVVVEPVLEGRNRLTAAFRFFLALPHILMVGGPMAVGGWLGWQTQQGWSVSFGPGILGGVAALAAILAWFAIVITGRHPNALWRLAAFYFRWRVRALAYMTLLRDEYPPFGDDPYPAQLVLPAPDEPRDRLAVFLRLLLALPHLVLLGILGLMWAFTTALAWAAILLTGRFPEMLYGFGLGVLAWSTRVEAYVLLLRDEYPPFSLRV